MPSIAPSIALALLISCHFTLLKALRHIDRETSAVKSIRLDHSLPDSVKINAGAVYDVRLGWVSVANENSCYWGHQGREGCETAKLGPWVSFLGSNSSPYLQNFENNGSRWSYDHSTITPALVGDSYKHYALEDARIFAWKQELFVSAALHSFGHIVRQDQESGWYQTIMRMDRDTRSFSFVKMFKDRPDGASGPPSPGKNWGFFQHYNKLLAFYYIFPCTEIYEVEDGQGSGLKLVVKTCYKDKDNLLASRVLLDLEHVHNSAHPVTWNNHGDLEILLMVHLRSTREVGGYNHWLVRMSHDDLTITHISHGIVFGTAMAHSQGPIHDAIIVGTITVTSSFGSDILHIFGGEGDLHSIYHCIDLDRVRWLPIGDVALIEHIDTRQQSSQ